ncbi:MAG: thiamine pyrophosphate-binding protein [Alphaproteobacteria bacterium]|nr:thiamine pyrophosphate-binding protein [Alphaproteobacteria bacterium]
MAIPDNTRTGGQILVDALARHGVDTAFCVAGESYLAVLDALYDHRNDIRLITCRHEAGATNMAEAYAKLTGRPGVAMVTRGPGACHGSIGLHTGLQDSTPMVLLIGQVARDQFDREAFQEVDYRQMFGPLAKWVAQIEQTDRIPEYMARAFHVATSGRPGPVVLALPEDMLREHAAVADTARYHVTRASPANEDMAALGAMLAKASRPIMLVGGGGWTPAASADILAFAEANNLPTACSFRRLDIMDNNRPQFVGDLSTAPNPKLVDAVRQSDLLLVVGARLGEITTRGYTLLGVPNPGRPLVHVHASAEELGRVFQPVLAIQSGMPQFAAEARRMRPADFSRRKGWSENLRATYVAWSSPKDYGGKLDLGQVMRQLRARLPADAIVTVDAGNFSGWPMRYLSFTQPRTFAAPTSGAMGYAVPAAVSAAITFPDRMVVGFVGDGGFMMTSQELATAVHYGAKPIMLVFNNGQYGTIKAHQARHHPGRYIATDLTNPDFAALAKAYGGHGETVERTEDFMPAFERALKSAKAAVIELRMDPDVISTSTTLSQMEAAARRANAG